MSMPAHRSHSALSCPAENQAIDDRETETHGWVWLGMHFHSHSTAAPDADPFDDTLPVPTAPLPRGK
jgi:hypothetical protein